MAANEAPPSVSAVFLTFVASAMIAAWLAKTVQRWQQRLEGASASVKCLRTPQNPPDKAPTAPKAPQIDSTGADLLKIQVRFFSRPEATTLYFAYSTRVKQIKEALEPYVGLPVSHMHLSMSKNGLPLSSFAQVYIYSIGEDLELDLCSRMHVLSCGLYGTTALEQDNGQDAEGEKEVEEEETDGLADEPEDLDDMLVLNFDHVQQLQDPCFYPALTQAYGAAMLEKLSGSNTDNVGNDPKLTAAMRSRCDLLSKNLAFFEKKRKFIASVSSACLDWRPDADAKEVKTMATELVKAADLTVARTVLELSDLFLDGIEFLVCGYVGSVELLEALLKAEASLPSQDELRLGARTGYIRSSIRAVATMLGQPPKKLSPRGDASSSVSSSPRSTGHVGMAAPSPRRRPKITNQDSLPADGTKQMMPSPDPDALRRVVVLLVTCLREEEWAAQAKMLCKYWKYQLGSVPFAERITQAVQKGDWILLEALLRARIYAR